MKISNQVVSASQNTQGHAQDKGDREQGISSIAVFQHKICEIFMRKFPFGQLLRKIEKIKNKVSQRSVTNRCGLCEIFGLKIY